MKKDLVIIGKIISPHGIKGEVKILPFTQSIDDIFSFKEIYDINKKIYKVKKRFSSNGKLVVKIDGIDDRNSSETLKNIELFVDKNELAEPADDEYYHTDLIGMKVINESNDLLGIVKYVHNFGAGDIIEIDFTEIKNNNMFIFNKVNFPKIDLQNKTIMFIESFEESVPPSKN